MTTEHINTTGKNNDPSKANPPTDATTPSNASASTPASSEPSPVGTPASAGATVTDAPATSANVFAETPAPEPRYLLTIDEGVVEKVASLAAQKVDGIIDMKGGVLSMIQEGLGGNDRRKGVTADVLDEENARVELSVILEYGKSALDVFDELKRVITSDVKKMTDLNVADMTVNIVDVMDREELNHKRGTTTAASDADIPDDFEEPETTRTV